MLPSALSKHGLIGNVGFKWRIGNFGTLDISATVRKLLNGPGTDPSVRARFLIDVEGRPQSDAQLKRAIHEIGLSGWAATLLKNQLPDGHWFTSGTTGSEMYRPKYVATFWHAIVLGDLGMTREDPRIRKTAELILDRFDQRSAGEEQLDYRPRGDGIEVCVTGMATRSLIRFGYLEHPAVQRSIDWIVRVQFADGGWNDAPARKGTLDAWECLSALAEVPVNMRNREVSNAIRKGAEFYLKRNLMHEGRNIYPPWFRIHYPNHYYYDLLVGLRLLAKLGYGKDSRLEPALRWLRKKRADDGTWCLDAAHPDIDSAGAGYRIDELVFPMMLEQPNTPSQLATVEALGVLAQVERAKNAE